MIRFWNPAAERISPMRLPTLSMYCRTSSFRKGRAVSIEFIIVPLRDRSDQVSGLAMIMR